VDAALFVAIGWHLAPWCTLGIMYEGMFVGILILKDAYLLPFLAEVVELRTHTKQQARLHEGIGTSKGNDAPYNNNTLACAFWIRFQRLLNRVFPIAISFVL
jgi:hypothetical protein